MKKFNAVCTLLGSIGIIVSIHTSTWSQNDPNNPSLIRGGTLVRTEYNREIPRIVEDKETVVFFMDKQSAFDRANIFIDGRYLGTLLPGRYAFAHACEGEHKVAVTWNYKDVANVPGALKDTPFQEVQKREHQRISTSSRLIIYNVHATRDGDLDLSEISTDNFSAIMNREQLEQSHVVSRYRDNCPNSAEADPNKDKVKLGARGGVSKPAPIPVVTAPIPTNRILKRYDLAAGTIFEHNGALRQHMKQGGVEQINMLAAEVRQLGNQVQQIMVTGHADRTGHEMQNWKLSEMRATTVAQLLTDLGIRNPIYVEGKGSSEPLSRHCVGQVVNQALKDCLAIDRRVRIDVIGNITETIEQQSPSPPQVMPSQRQGQLSGQVGEQGTYTLGSGSSRLFRPNEISHYPPLGYYSSGSRLFMPLAHWK